MKRLASVVVLVLMASLLWRSVAASTTVMVSEGQFDVLGNSLVGKLTFESTADSTNIVVKDERGVSIPLIVRDPRDPVFPVLPEDPFIIWRNAMLDRMLADTRLTYEGIATMVVDSLRVAGCTNISVHGATVSYQQTKDPASATSWLIQRRTVSPRALQLQRFLAPIIRQLQSGRTVYVLWGGRTLSYSAVQAESIRSSCVTTRNASTSSRIHPDLLDLQQRPVSPVTLRQEVRQ